MRITLETTEDFGVYQQGFFLRDEVDIPVPKLRPLSVLGAGKNPRKVLDGVRNNQAKHIYHGTNHSYETEQFIYHVRDSDFM